MDTHVQTKAKEVKVIITRRVLCMLIWVTIWDRRNRILPTIFVCVCVCVGGGGAGIGGMGVGVMGVGVCVCVCVWGGGGGGGGWFGIC